MYPYVVIDYRGFQDKTSVCQEGGKNPVWNQNYTFSIFRLEENITLRCFSKSFIIDDFIGMEMLKVSHFSKAFEEAVFAVPIKMK